MKVKNCTQVFSHSVATAMNVAARTSVELSPDSEFYLDPKASETADLLMSFDRLFDSVNGTLLYPLPGKELRCCDAAYRILEIISTCFVIYVFNRRKFWRSVKTSVSKELGSICTGNDSHYWQIISKQL
jgi:hypothetical protein